MFPDRRHWRISADRRDFKVVGAALDAAAALFGVGVGLTADEFALWLHLKDVLVWRNRDHASCCVAPD